MKNDPPPLKELRKGRNSPKFTNKMKKNIHPQYYDKTKVKCSCGADFEVGSTIPDIKVEICSSCHPLYTGNKRIVDTAGRVDRFQARLKKFEEMKEQAAKRSAKPKTEKAETKEEAETPEKEG